MSDIKVEAIEDMESQINHYKSELSGIFLIDCDYISAIEGYLKEESNTTRNEGFVSNILTYKVEAFIEMSGKENGVNHHDVKGAICELFGLAVRSKNHARRFVFELLQIAIDDLFTEHNGRCNTIH